MHKPKRHISKRTNFYGGRRNRNATAFISKTNRINIFAILVPIYHSVYLFNLGAKQHIIIGTRQRIFHSSTCPVAARRK